MLRSPVILFFYAALAMPVAAQEAGTDLVGAFSPADHQAQCSPADGYAAALDGARTFLWRPRWVEAIVSDDALRSEVITLAEQALASAPYSVTHKPVPPPGATLNDYASIGPYWWPDPDLDNGLPYMRRDGEVNPERNGPEFDRTRLRNLSQDMRNLALAYHATGEGRYAEHAMVMARAWFIDAETRMTPNFEFAQGIPGRVTGRAEGIIEASHLTTIIEALGLLKRSPAFTAADDVALRAWYRDFVLWMATSEIGIAEMQKTNNHGVFYDFYLAQFALFAGAPDVAINVVQAFPEYRLGLQMDQQGRFHEELRRTRSWHYSNYVVDGAARLATVAECTGLDLWNAQLPDGRSLMTARTFLDRYMDMLESWPFPDTDLERGRIDTMRERADRVEVLMRPEREATRLQHLP